MTLKIAPFLRDTDLDNRRRERALLARRPMLRYLERNEHLLLGSTSITVTEAPPPAEPSPALPKAPAAHEIPEVDRARHMARVFAPDAIAAARELLGATAKTDSKRDTAALSRSSAALDRADRDAGWRSVPWAGPMEVANPFADIGPELANFREVLEHLSTQWTLASCAYRAADARIDPILLTGEPGVGKTHFAAALADLIDVRMSVFSAGSAQDGMQLCGSDARWSGTRPGMVFDTLSLHNSAAPVLMVDEIDKLAPNSGAYRDTPVNTLLDLLEPDSARRYRDMSLQLEMDASRMIVVCTANERASISPPLLSRLTEFRVAAPTVEQRRCILERYLEKLIESHECPAGMALDELSAEVALATPDLDVRALLRLVRAGFANALAADSDRIILAPPRRGVVRQRIGFV